MPNWKKLNPTIEGPPICNLMLSFRIKLKQIWSMPRHGGIIRKWRDIVRFLVSRGYTEISQNNTTYMVIIKNGRQPWTHRKSNEFIRSSSRAPILPPKFDYKPPLNYANAAVWQDCLFLLKMFPPVKNLESSDSAMTTAPRPPFLALIEHALTSTSLEHRGCVEVTQCSKTASTLNTSWLLLGLNT